MIHLRSRARALFAVPIDGKSLHGWFRVRGEAEEQAGDCRRETGDQGRLLLAQRAQQSIEDLGGFHSQGLPRDRFPSVVRLVQRRVGGLNS